MNTVSEAQSTFPFSLTEKHRSISEASFVQQALVNRINIIELLSRSAVFGAYGIVTVISTDQTIRVNHNIDIVFREMQ